ncbi:MAG: RNA methyltransferase [Myxococcota bacterium]
MKRTDPEVFRVGGTEPLPADPETVIRALRPVATEARIRRMEEVITRRTTDVVPICEGFYDPHNASAVLRSADAFGLQQVHVIEEDVSFAASHNVTKGTERWLDVIRHRDAEACADAIHDRGYRLLAASMEGTVKPEDLRAMPKVAVIFGNEHRGVSEALRRRADDTFAIPMVGFVESLNVSAAAAITLYTARGDRPGNLDAPTKRELLAHFLVRGVKDSLRIIEEYQRRG